MGDGLDGVFGANPKAIEVEGFAAFGWRHCFLSFCLPSCAA